MGLGLAIAQPARPVLVVTGDGEQLMGLGGFATIALQAPANLTILVLDNGLYGETGGQRSHTSGGTDLAAVARGCGIADASRITDMAGVEALAAAIAGPGGGPRVAVVVDLAEAPRVLPSRDGPCCAGGCRPRWGLPPETRLQTAHAGSDCALRRGPEAFPAPCQPGDPALIQPEAERTHGHAHAERRPRRSARRCASSARASPANTGASWMPAAAIRPNSSRR